MYILSLPMDGIHHLGAFAKTRDAQTRTMREQTSIVGPNMPAMYPPAGKTDESNRALRSLIARFPYNSLAMVAKEMLGGSSVPAAPAATRPAQTPSVQAGSRSQPFTGAVGPGTATTPAGSRGASCGDIISASSSVMNSRALARSAL